MNFPGEQVVTDRRKLTRTLLGATLLWGSLLAASLYLSLSQADQEMLGLARNEARANFNKDQVFRSWATSHGGVYVPVTPQTPPNPFLAHIPERDLVTPSGRRLTLVNPAYMVRQMMDEYAELYGVRGRIVSLTPLNPNNAPDAWERRVLQSFAHSTDEAFEWTAIDGQPYLRLMRPMMTVEGCLKCHADEGYTNGGINGGVGVSVPLQPYLRVTDRRKQRLWLTHGAIWLFGMAGVVVGGVSGRRQIAERNLFQQRIWHQANFDSLTRLANRNLFFDRVEQALAGARRSGQKLALMFIDLDRFKDVNDTLGHGQGDSLLQRAAERLAGCVRESDTISRIGGDEFTVLLSDLQSADSATVVARSILATMAEPFMLDRQPVHISASIGITLFPDDADDATTLLKNADTAVYQAKADGRNTYRYFTWEMTQRARERVQLENELREAIKGDQFCLYYQPIFATESRRAQGAEVLLRWQHPQRGLVGPDTFIGIAEQSGLIVPIGEIVLRKAVQQLKEWQQEGIQLHHLAINVSTRQCRSAGFAPFVQRLVQEAGPDISRRLAFEITESLFLGDEADAGELLAEWRSLGISISIDDFGTGYSSLSYLRRFPVDILKIDRSFVRDIAADPADASLCEAIISMSHLLGIKVVAEGVETEEQLAILGARHSDFCQGFLLARPGPADTVAPYFR
jgi:diguanylate cyclase (GGDEF)-like protein